MGVYKRQGILTALVIYAGFLFGAINSVFLFPKLLTPEQYGIYRTILSIIAVLNQLLLFGSTSVLINFHSRTDNKNALTSSVFYFVSTAFILFVLFSVFGYDVIKIFVGNKYIDILPYIRNIYILLFCGIAMSVFASYCIIQFATITANVFREFLIKVVATVSIFLFIVWQLSFAELIYIFTLSNVVLIGFFLLILLAFYRFRFTYNASNFIQQNLKAISNYALYSFFTGTSSILLLNVDSMMITKYVDKGFDANAIFSTAFFIATVIQTPQRSLAQISSPLFAQLFVDENYNEIEKNYKKTALIQMLAGGILFALVWCNIDSIYQFMRAEYAEGKWVALCILIAKFIEMATGSNSEIISSSRHYRFMFYSFVLMIVFVIICNYFLITHYGIIGAAVNAIFVSFLFNASRFLLLKWKYKISPFSMPYYKGLAIVLLVFSVGMILPKNANFLIDLCYRSSIISFLFFSLIYFCNISDDINNLFNKAITQIKNKVSK